MSKKIFVSHNFVDRTVKKAVHTMMQQVEQQMDIELVMVDNDVSYNGSTAIEWELTHLMSDCDAALFILGDIPRTSPWLDKEANQAIAKEMSIIVTCLPDTNGDKPAFMDQIQYFCANWQLNSIVDAINDC